jgi:integrase
MTTERLRVYIGPRRKRKAGGYYPKWPYRYQLPGQPWVHGTGAFTEAATRQLVDGLIQDHLLRLRMAERGMFEAPAVPIEKHIADYLKWGRHGGGKGGLPWSAEHLGHRRSQLAAWVRLLDLKALEDVDYDAFSAANTDRLERGLAPNTVNHHAWALVAFMKWCLDRKRVAANCLERFSSLDRRPRRERGSFDLNEFQALLSAAPPSRQLLYRMAALTGLRRSALASLQVKDVDFEAGLVTLPWSAAKNRKTTVKPLPRGLVADLRSDCAGKKPESPLLDFSLRQAARCIHRDMRAAGIPMVKEARRRDFHSLKASLGTLLDDAGTPTELTQKALDHASFQQTRGYIKREIGSLRTVVQDLESRMGRGEFHAPGNRESRGPISRGQNDEGPSPAHWALVPGAVPPLSSFLSLPGDIRVSDSVPGGAAAHLQAAHDHVRDQREHEEYQQEPGDSL